MKKTYVLVNTRKGNMYVSGYNLGKGLFLHKLVTKAGMNIIDAKTYTLSDIDKGILDTTKSNYWTITHKSGMSVKQFSHTPMRLKDVIDEAGKIRHLDWDKDAQELSTEDYRNAVREMHGF